MSRTKDWLMDLEEQANDRHIAKILGISYDDLVELEWKIESDQNNDGLIFLYRIEFGKSSPKEILAKIEKLQDGCRVIVEPWELDAQYNYINDQFDAITESRINLKAFYKELESLKNLSQLQAEGDKMKKKLNQQIFISIIGSMEAFLSEVFMKLVFDEKQYFQAFVETHSEFKSRKFELREIFEQQKHLDVIVKKTILDTIFHNLWIVKKMYTNTFGISFPEIEKMNSHIIVRHDLVHRNGKTKEGTELVINDSQIDKLILDVTDFIDSICVELKIK